MLDKVLNEISSEDLAVHVVWTPVLPSDKRSSVDRAHKLFAEDSRATQYWDGEQDLGQLYGEIIELPNGRKLAWDIYFVFAEGVQWIDAPPMPDDWQHQLGLDERHFDGDKLRESIKTILSRSND